MKKQSNLKTWQILVSLILTVIWVTPGSARAEGRQWLQVGDEIRFGDLQQGHITLHGPYSSGAIQVAVPANWQLTEGAELQLDLATYFNDPQSGIDLTGRQILGGQLHVMVNGLEIGSILLDQTGQRTVSLAIPSDALAASQDGINHIVEFNLISDETCLYDLNTSVVLLTSSRILFPHRTVSLTNDLTRLPSPIYQPNTLVKAKTSLVIPDQPTEEELSAALNVAAGFGLMTAGKHPVELVPAGQLTQQDLTSNHMILVGKPGGLPPLAAVDLPVDFKDGKFNAPNASDQDGIIQLISSPWNSARAILLVSGATDEGVLKSGHVIRSGMVVPDQTPNVAIVVQAGSASEDQLIATDRTLADLGYSETVIKGVGPRKAHFSFYAPPGMYVNSSAYLDLLYSHTALLDFWRSGFVVNLNGQPVGSGRLSEDSAQSGKLRLFIPSNLIRPGNNLLSVEANLAPLDYCSNYQYLNTWMSIHPDTNLHIPLDYKPKGVANQYTDLAGYPDFFLQTSLDNQLTFALPRDPLIWKMAADVAYKLGDMSTWGIPMEGARAGYSAGSSPQSQLWGISDIQVLFDEKLAIMPDTSNLIVFGLPKELTSMQWLNARLPAKFEPGTDTPQKDALPFVFQTSTQTSEGYLELADMPNNRLPVILAVLGNSEKGLTWASKGLTDPALGEKLRVNFAILRNDQVISSRIETAGAGANTQQSLSGLAMGGLLAAPIQQRPAWLLPVIGVTLGLMVIVIIIVIVSSRRQRRASG